MLFKTKYFINQTITQKTGRQKHDLPTEVYGIRLKTLLPCLYSPVGWRPFTIEIGQIPWFMGIFMIKMDGGVYLSIFTPGYLDKYTW